MTDPREPELREVEAKLLSLASRAAPAPGAAEQRQLLYACAFAAGKRRERAAAWRWRAASAALAIAMVAALLPARQTSPMAQQAPVNTAPGEQPDSFSALVESFFPSPAPSGDLEAWRVEPAPAATLSDQLAQHERATPQERSLSVGAMTRAALLP